MLKLAMRIRSVGLLLVKTAGAGRGASNCDLTCATPLSSFEKSTPLVTPNPSSANSPAIVAPGPMKRVSGRRDLVERLRFRNQNIRPPCLESIQGLKLPDEPNGAAHRRRLHAGLIRRRRRRDRCVPALRRLVRGRLD